MCRAHSVDLSAPDILSKTFEVPARVIEHFKSEAGDGVDRLTTDLNHPARRFVVSIAEA